MAKRKVLTEATGHVDLPPEEVGALLWPDLTTAT
jgi:hypothetical protein